MSLNGKKVTDFHFLLFLCERNYLNVLSNHLQTGETILNVICRGVSPNLSTIWTSDVTEQGVMNEFEEYLKEQNGKEVKKIDFFKYLIEQSRSGENSNDKIIAALNQCDVNNSTPIEHFVRTFKPQDDINLLKYLISLPGVDINRQNDQTTTILHQICQNINTSSVNFFKYIVQNLNPNFNLRNHHNQTPYDIAFTNFSPNQSSVDIMTYLLTLPNIDMTNLNPLGRTPLHQSCLFINYIPLVVFKHLIEQCDANVCKKDFYGHTPIQLALLHSTKPPNIDSIPRNMPQTGANTAKLEYLLSKCNDDDIIYSGKMNILEHMCNNVSNLDLSIFRNYIERRSRINIEKKLIGSAGLEPATENENLSIKEQFDDHCYSPIYQAFSNLDHGVDFNIVLYLLDQIKRNLSLNTSPTTTTTTTTTKLNNNNDDNGNKIVMNHVQINDDLVRDVLFTDIRAEDLLAAIQSKASKSLIVPIEIFRVLIEDFDAFVIHQNTPKDDSHLYFGFDCQTDIIKYFLHCIGIDIDNSYINTSLGDNLRHVKLKSDCLALDLTQILKKLRVRFRTSLYYFTKFSLDRGFFKSCGQISKYLFFLTSLSSCGSDMVNLLCNNTNNVNFCTIFKNKTWLLFLMNKKKWVGPYSETMNDNHGEDHYVDVNEAHSDYYSDYSSDYSDSSEEESDSDDNLLDYTIQDDGDVSEVSFDSDRKYDDADDYSDDDYDDDYDGEYGEHDDNYDYYGDSGSDGGSDSSGDSGADLDDLSVRQRTHRFPQIQEKPKFVQLDSQLAQIIETVIEKSLEQL
jgi:hypothetical protein